MKSLITFALFTLSLQAQGIEIGPITGRLTNHSNFKTSQFRISLILSCRSQSFVGPMPSCGDTSYVVSVNADGSYTIPRLEVANGFENSLQIDLGLPFEERGHLATYFRGWIFFDGNIGKAADQLNEFTVFEALAQMTIYQGVNQDEFLAGAGRDVIQRFELSFKDDRKLPGINSTYWVSLLGDNGTSEVPGMIQESLLIVAGSLPADSRVTVKGKLNVTDSSTRAPVTMEATVPFSSVLPAQARTFKINPSDVPLYDRTAEGDYDHVEFQLASYENEKYESSNFGGHLSFTCQDRKARGILSVKSRSGAPLEFSGDLELSGTCGGEHAELNFKMPYRSSRTEEVLSVGVTRMVRGRWMVISPDDKWDWQVRGGQYTFKLPIKTKSGKVVGDMHVP